MKKQYITVDAFKAMEGTEKLDAIYDFLLSEFTPFNDVKTSEPPYNPAQPVMDAIKMARETAGMDAAQGAIAAHDQIKVGDTVILKSGGPVMTITTLQRDNGRSIAAMVSWFRDGKFWELPLPSLDMVVKHSVVLPSESKMTTEHPSPDPHS